MNKPKIEIVKEYIDGAKWEVVKILFKEPHIKVSDVKLLVNWLEEELNALFQIKGTKMDEQEEIIMKIDKAFEDIFK